MSVQGSNEPLVADDAWVAGGLAAIVHELSEPRKHLVEPVTPLDAYMFLFREVPAVNIQRRVRDAYAYVARHPRRRTDRGHVYVFRDVRDGDSAIVKIGSSIRVRRRIQEWRTSLGARDDELALLFSASCSDIRLAEQIVHALLLYQWQPWRVRADTGASLVEYFAVENLDALRLLVRACARHVTWFTERRHLRLADLA